MVTFRCLVATVPTPTLRIAPPIRIQVLRGNNATQLITPLAHVNLLCRFFYPPLHTLSHSLTHPLTLTHSLSTFLLVFQYSLLPPVPTPHSPPWRPPMDTPPPPQKHKG